MPPRTKAHVLADIEKKVAEQNIQIELTEDREAAESVSDAEFGSVIGPSIRDPLARIGFDPKQVANLPGDLRLGTGFLLGAYFGERTPQGVEDMLSQFQPKKDLITVTPLGREKRQVGTTVHEAIHRGFQVLRNEGIIPDTYPDVEHKGTIISEEVFIRVLDWIGGDEQTKKDTEQWLSDGGYASPQQLLRDIDVRLLMQDFFDKANSYLRKNGRPTIDVTLPIPERPEKEK